MPDINNYIKKVGKTCKKFNLIEPEDKILIGLSGGKDSLFLVEALAAVKKHLPFNIDIYGCHIHINEVGYNIDIDYIKSFCEHVNIPLFIEDISVNLFANPKKAPCFVCSWHRRKHLFALTRKFKCNKLALGHHMDDAIETLLMNMVYHGSISSLPAKLKMFSGRVHLIRPLLELTQEDMLCISNIKNYNVLQNECPYSDRTKRGEIREIIDKLHKMHPLARKNIFRSMGNIFNEYLPNSRCDYV